MKIERKHLTIGGTVVALGVLVALILRPGTVTVDTAVVDRGPLRVTVDENGETRVRERYVISAPVTGRLTRLTCEPGDSVTAGEVIARIYPLPLDTRARTEAAARLQAAEAAHRAAGAAREQADAVWQQARRTRERYERLEAEAAGAVARQQLDEARTAERAAAAALERARDAAAAAAYDTETARAALLGSEGAAPAEPTLVRAPADGRVLRLHEECERAVTAGSPLLEIGDPADLEVVVDVLTEDAARLHEDATALVTTGPGSDTLVGQIARIEPSAFTKVSPLGVEEQRVNVIVTFDRVPAALGDRYRVDASLVAWEADDVLRVPVSALFRTDGGGWGVFVLEDGRARLREIRLGPRGRHHAVVEAGLVAGDVVIRYPSEDLEDGARADAVLERETRLQARPGRERASGRFDRAPQRERAIHGPHHRARTAGAPGRAAGALNLPGSRDPPSAEPRDGSRHAAPRHSAPDQLLGLVLGFLLSPVILRAAWAAARA